MPHLHAFAVTSLIGLTASFVVAAPDEDVYGQSYLAHIAAAHASLRLDEVGEAQRWLAAAPPTHRGWEWRHLAAAADTSLRRIASGLDDVTAMAWSPAGGVLAVGAGDGAVVLYDPTTGERLRTLPPHAGRIYGLAFDATGTRLASSSRDKTVRICSVATGEVVTEIADADSHIMGIAFSPDGRRVAGTLLSLVKIWNVDSGAVERTLVGHVERPPVVAVAWSADGSRIVSGGWDNNVIVWDAATGGIVHKLGPGYGQGEYVQFRGVAWGPGDDTVVAIGSDGTWRQWDAATGERTHLVAAHAGDVDALALVADQDVFTASQDGLVKQWDCRDGTLRATLRGHDDAIQTLAVSPDGREIASAGSGGIVRVHATDPLEYPAPWSVCSSGPWALAFTPGGDRLLVAGNDLTLWDVHTRRKLRTYEGHDAEVTSVACAPDGRRFVSGSNDRTVRVWDLETRETLFVTEALPGVIRDVAWSPDGRTFAAAASGKMVRVWGDDFEVRSTFEVGRLLRLAYSPDSRRLAMTDAEGAVHLVDTETMEIVTSLAPEDLRPRECVFAPDGRTLAVTCDDTTIRVFDLANLPAMRTLRGHRQTAYAVGFLDGGRRLVTSAYDSTVKVWDPAWGVCTLTLPSPEWVWSMTVSPDGNTVAWGPVDGRVVLSAAPGR